MCCTSSLVGDELHAVRLELVAFPADGVGRANQDATTVDRVFAPVVGSVAWPVAQCRLVSPKSVGVILCPANHICSASIPVSAKYATAPYGLKFEMHHFTRTETAYTYSASLLFLNMCTSDIKGKYETNGAEPAEHGRSHQSVGRKAVCGVDGEYITFDASKHLKNAQESYDTPLGCQG